MPWSASSLTRTERNAVLRALKAEGIKPPKKGYCVRAFGGEICRHHPYKYDKSDTGYQVISIRKPRGLAGVSDVVYPKAGKISTVRLRARR